MHNQATEEVFEIRNDVKDPSGLSTKRGMDMGVNLTRTALAHPQFRWRDRIATVDIYKAGDQLMLHFFCPKCANALQMNSDRKEIRWSPGENGGRLSIGAFRCTWAGCGLSIQVDDNVAKEV